MVKEEKLKDAVEDAEDVVEDVLDIAEDLGLISEKKADKILAKVKQYKKQILIAIPTLVAVVLLVQSQL
jgi:hypothetical protein|tara:strand:+ start:756 stop:962 length:207 start_codon:yes stop_codon:yes gene_type:complete